jgi:hypothetical protein
MDPTEGAVADTVTLTREKLRAPRAGAFAGILFSVLLVTSLVLIRISVPASPAESGDWLLDRFTQVGVAVNLLPIAGIAFLWFIGVLRDRLGEREDKFFATVFFGSGLLFVSMLFSASALASGMIVAFGSMPDKVAGSAVYVFGRSVAYQIMNVYAAKMAAAFMISTCTLSVKTGIFPRWIAWVGYVLAILLFFAGTHVYWAPMLFPFWVLIVSIHILRANMKA